MTMITALIRLPTGPPPELFVHLCQHLQVDLWHVLPHQPPAPPLTLPGLLAPPAGESVLRREESEITAFTLLLLTL